MSYAAGEAATHLCLGPLAELSAPSGSSIGGNGARASSTVVTRRPPGGAWGYHLLPSLMGPQDGVEVVLGVMDELVHRRCRTDVRTALLGFGDWFTELRRRSTELGSDDRITVTGRADKAMIADHLSAADVGLCPDLKLLSMIFRL